MGKQRFFWASDLDSDIQLVRSSVFLILMHIIQYSAHVIYRVFLPIANHDWIKKVRHIILLYLESTLKALQVLLQSF